MNPKLKRMIAPCVLSLAMPVAMPAQAHHSFAMFDLGRQITIEGTVRSFQYTNPHIWINLTVIDPKTGQPVELLPPWRWFWRMLSLALLP